MFARNVGIIIGMIMLSNALGVIFVLLTKSFPKCMVYTSIIVTFLFFIAIIVISIVLEIYALTVVFGIITLLTALILCCNWSKIKIGIVLIGTAG